MSLLPHDTFVNASRQLYADEGSGGGGGGGSTLQSPASITPAANGSAVLSLAVSGGAGQDATINITNTTGNDAVIAMSNTAGGNSVIEMGLAASAIAVFAPSGANAGEFNVAPVLPNGSPGTPNLSVDTVGGTVTAQNLLLVGNLGSGANQFAAAPLTANTSKISQTVAASGSMSIGSSIANPAGLVVSDVARSLTANYVQVAGSPGNIPLYLQGSQGPANQCTITPDINGGGVLQLGSNSTADSPNFATVSISDTAVNINKLGGAPQQLLASQNLAPGNVTQTTFVFPAPVGEGLYSIVGCSNGTTTANSRQAQASCICYVDSTGLIQMGGAAFADVGSVGAADCIEWAPTANTSFTGVYTGAQQVNNFSIFAFKLSGPIPGVVV
jgi:hypothetical protein